MSQNKLKAMNNGVSVSGPPTTTAMSNGNCQMQASNGIQTQSAAELKARKASLTPLEYRVTQQRETERPFSNKYNKFWESGTYHCVVCDAELFKSETKFESKSGWPAFYNVVDPQRVKLTPDLSYVGANLLLLVAKPDLARTEVSCANCNAHLGHLFKDGPKPTGLRYCINSSSLNFVSSNEDGFSNRPKSLKTPTSLSNGIGPIQNSNSSAPPREYICNPENMCNRQTYTPSPPPTMNSRLPGYSSPPQPHSLACTPTGAKEFVSRNASARDNFFSTFDPTNSNSLPPMGALCLNNQSCQRKPPVKKSSTVEETLKNSIISNGAENENRNILPITNGNGLTNNKNITNVRSSNPNVVSSSSKPPLATKTSNVNVNTNTRNGTGSTSSSTVLLPTTSKTNPNLNSNTNNGPVTVTSTKSRFPFSKGVSLTAARINFLQKIATATNKDSPSRWATTFNARWSTRSSASSSPSSSNNTRNIEQENMIISNCNNDSASSANSSRFPSSCSSGSLCTVSRQPTRPDDIKIASPRRSTSSFFAKTSQTPTVEQVSIAPKTVALRETTL